MKIIIWGRSSIDTDNAHQRQIKKLGLPLILLEGEDKKAEFLVDSSLIINHDGGLQKPQNAWQINTGGGSMSNEPPTEISKPGKIHWNTFIENLENFLTQIKGKSQISKEDIELLYAIDSELEGFLSPFATLHPMGKVTEDAKVNKSALQAYVNKKLGK